MPPAALAALAKRAGKSIKTAEKYWDQAKKSVATALKGRKKKRGKGELKKPRDKWASVMGIVKKRLGLATEELLFVGLPPELLIEADVLSEDVEVKSVIVAEEKLTSLDRTWATIALGEAWRVDKFGMESAVFERTAGSIVMKADFVEVLSEAQTGTVKQHLQKLFPNVMDVYIDFLVKQLSR